MPIVKSKIRNSSQNILCICILVLIIFSAGAMLYWGELKYKIVTEVIDFTDPISIYLLCLGVVSIIVLSSILKLLLLFIFDDFLIGKTFDSKQISNKLRMHLQTHECLCSILCLNIIGYVVCCWLFLKCDLKFNLGYLLVIVSSSIIFACMTLWTDYDDVDLSSILNLETSIGFSWALGSYIAFYKNIFEGMTKRMVQFEEEKNIKLLVKKLVIICPRSCNANGSLDNKDGNLKCFGNLKEIICDEGANNNRNLKTNVFKIKGPSDVYIAAEIPSPLSTLYEMRDVMDPVVLEYHRECFIKALEVLLKSEPCIILRYDDLNSAEPLHSFLLSKLEDGNFISVIK